MLVYRVVEAHKGESEVGDVAGSGRVSMAHGRTSSQAVEALMANWSISLAMARLKLSQTGHGQTADQRSMS